LRGLEYLNWYQTGSVGFEEGAAVSMAPTDGADFITLYFGFGFEGVSAADQAALMDDAMLYLGIA
jgi:hypothetical protein